MLASPIRNRSVILGRALPLVAALAALTCGCRVFESTIADPAKLSLTIAPDPVAAEASDDPDYTWRASFTATLTETAGVGANISSINATISEVVDGAVVTGGEAPVVKVEFPDAPTRVEANATAAIECVVHYTLAGGGSQAVVDVVVGVKDDPGYTLSVTARANVE